MNVLAFVTASPCDSCTDENCGESGCHAYRMVRQIDVWAGKTAALIAEEPDLDLRGQMCEVQAEAWSRMLCDRSARLNNQEFLRACKCRVVAGGLSEHGIPASGQDT